MKTDDKEKTVKVDLTLFELEWILESLGYFRQNRLPTLHEKYTDPLEKKINAARVELEK